MLSGYDGAVLRYTPDIEGATIKNVSPVPLEVKLHVEFPEVTKSGFGRPNMRMLTAGTETGGFKIDRAASVAGGTSGKGFILDYSAIVGPSGHLRMVWVDMDTPGPPPSVDISASDDYGGLGPVEPVITRDTMESIDERPPTDVTSPPLGATVVSWNGKTNGAGMGLDQYKAGFPQGVSVASVSTSQGVRQAISNVGSNMYTVQLMYYLGDYAGTWYTGGNSAIDGEAVSVNGHSRVMAYVDFAPGNTFFYEPSTTGSYSSYSSITFRNCSFADRYVFGAAS